MLEPAIEQFEADLVALIAERDREISLVETQVDAVEVQTWQDMVDLVGQGMFIDQYKLEDLYPLCLEDLRNFYDPDAIE